MPAPKLSHRLLHSLRGDRGAVALLLGTFFGLNWQLLANQVSEKWDAEIFFAPFYHYIASLARSGHLLYWNPFCAGGSPDFAEPQLGAFSPVTLLFGLLAGPGAFGFHLYWLGTWLLGGLGMYVLARALSAPPWGALVTALAVVFCGLYIGHAEHLSVVYSFSFVPWVLWRVRAALVTGRLWAAAQAGALWGLAALAGNPAVHVPSALFIGLVSLAWLPARSPGNSLWLPWRRYALTMVLLAGVGVLVLAPAYLSFRYEVVGFSHRALPLPRGMVLDQKFGWGWLTALATPALVIFNGIPAWDKFDISMRPIYFGAVVPILAVSTLWRCRRSWQTWVLFGAGVFCLGVSLGNLVPLRSWLYDLLPFTRYFRHPPMFRGFFVLAMAMLAAPATAFIENVRRGQTVERSLHPLLVAAGGCAGVSIAACVGLTFSVPDRLWEVTPRAAFVHFAFAWMGPVLLCALAVCLPVYSRTFTGSPPARVLLCALAVCLPVVRRGLPGALVALTVVDLGAAYLLTDQVAFWSHPSAIVDTSAQSLTDLGPAGFARVAGESENANLYARQTVFRAYTAMRNEMQVRWATDESLQRYVLGPRRVYFAASVPTVPTTPAAFDLLVERIRTLGALPVVRQTREGLLQPATDPSTAEGIATAPAAQALDCRVLAYHDNDFALEVDCPGDGYLMITDRWSRSWQATVNGRPVPIEGGDFLFRLVPVQAGRNLVAMRYEITWVRVLVLLSWGTLAAVGAAALGGWWKRRPTAAVKLARPVEARFELDEARTAVGV